MIHRLLLWVGLGLSAVSAYFSVVGLSNIFAGATTSVIVMGVVLEIAKLSAASWIFRNWKLTTAPIKAYLTVAVVVLSLVSSAGIFGYLAKAHIELGTTIQTSVGVEDKVLDVKIKEKQAQVDTATASISNLDTQSNDLAKTGLDKNPLLKQKQMEVLSKSRASAVAQRDVLSSELTTLMSRKAEVSAREAKMEAEVGPLKYVAQIAYGADDKEVIEKTVRWMILILVSVFDPLAICLLIASNDGMMREKSGLKANEDGIVEVEHTNIKEMA